MIAVFKHYISLILNMVLTILKQYHLICVGRLYYSVFLSIIRNNSVLVSAEIILRFFLLNVSWLTPSILYILCHSILLQDVQVIWIAESCWLLFCHVLFQFVLLRFILYMFYSIPFCSILFSSSLLRLILFQFSSNSSLCLNRLTQPQRLWGTGSFKVFPVPKPPHWITNFLRHKIFFKVFPVPKRPYSAPKTLRHTTCQDLSCA